MVEKGNTQHVTRVLQSEGDLIIFRTGYHIARRMVVGGDNRRGPVGERVGKYLPEMDKGKPLNLSYINREGSSACKTFPCNELMNIVSIIVYRATTRTYSRSGRFVGC